ncbi:MAG: hypothetical protein H8F28_15975 [Fibrella sp.]|nr:hypothetical protein [Armatimonadota bacterium]
MGSGARYVPANIAPAANVGIDEEYILRLSGKLNERPLYAPDDWNKRAVGTKRHPASYRQNLPLPDDLIFEDARPGNTPNNCVAFILPDGRTVVNLAPFTRVEKGGPAYAWDFGDTDLYGDGVRGSHGATGLSAIGGSIRKGELTGKTPIRHAIKVNVFAEKNLSYNDGGTRGYRWPATSADSYAANSYRSKNREMEAGALLAIPPAIKEADLGLKTPVGRKLFAALQDYGAYIVDDAAWDCHYICAEVGVNEEIKTTHGYDLHMNNGDYKADVNKLFAALSVVTNNGTKSVGGGGAPRQPPAPPLILPTAIRVR